MERKGREAGERGEKGKGRERIEMRCDERGVHRCKA